jgi:hypothetical protein
LTHSLPIHPLIAREDLIKRLGGKNERAFSRSLRSKVQHGVRTLYRLMKPRTLFAKERIKKVGNGRVCLYDGMTLKSPKLSRSLCDSEELICFVTTIGTEIDLEIAGMMSRGRLSEAFIMDLAEQFHRRMERQCSKEKKAVTLRFSPGYCDWSIEEQKKLFELFDSKTAGIELKESCLMIPRKSISAVFGVYPVNGDTVPNPYNPCIECSKIDCPSRRT